MAEFGAGTVRRPLNYWRIGRWSAACVLLLVPLAMMQVSDEWHWTAASFVFAGAAIGGTILLYEFAERLNHSRAYRAGVALVLLACFLTVWTTIVRDDGTGMAYFMIVMAAGTSAFAARFRPAGMARAMLGVAAMQALLGIAVATAPATAQTPDGPTSALAFAAVFTALWLAAALCFRASVSAAPEH
ncbi:hypothetical protein [Pelagerythrobacter sp.]|uniref:hypothetical protein n=1 Tax=Pelagerythrobacter sp. TaxID=2800702 RepID=UPI0035B2B514